MTNKDSLNEHVSNDELPVSYQIAVEAILAEPVPKVDLTRLLRHPLGEGRGEGVIAPENRRRKWLRRVGGALVASAVAAALLVCIAVLRPTSAWAQVAEAVRKQAWVHVVMTAPDNSARVESWFSPAKKVAAVRSPGITLFLDLNQNKLQRYDEKEHAIYVSEPQSSDRDQFALLDTILQSITDREDLKKGDTGAVKLIAQSRREMQEGDKRWTEHVLEFEHPRRSPSRFRQVFRVPAGEQLPTRMTEEFVGNGEAVSRSCDIDYPATGPANLFALDVPQDAKVIDTRPDEALKTLLAAYKTQQQRPLEPYTATVLHTDPSSDWKDIFFAYQVRSDGSGLVVDQVDLQQLLDFRHRVHGREIHIPDGADRVQWWKAEVAKLATTRMGVSQAVYIPGQAGYPLIGLPSDRVRATLEPKPAFGPSDCPRLTIENAKTGEKERVYWFDPSRGHMIVRWETHRREKPTDWIHTVVVDQAEKSPQGHWFATHLRQGRVEHSGDELPAERGVGPVRTSVFRIVIEFDK